MRQATKQTINNNLCLVTFKEPPAWKGKPSNTWVVLALPAVVVHGRHSSARISKQDVRSDRSIPPPPLLRLLLIRQIFPRGLGQATVRPNTAASTAAATARAASELRCRRPTPASPVAAVALPALPATNIAQTRKRISECNYQSFRLVKRNGGIHLKKLLGGNEQFL